MRKCFWFFVVALLVLSSAMVFAANICGGGNEFEWLGKIPGSVDLDSVSAGGANLVGISHGQVIVFGKGLTIMETGIRNALLPLWRGNLVSGSLVAYRNGYLTQWNRSGNAIPLTRRIVKKPVRAAFSQDDSMFAFGGDNQLVWNVYGQENGIQVNNLTSIAFGPDNTLYFTADGKLYSAVQTKRGVDVTNLSVEADQVGTGVGKIYAVSRWGLVPYHRVPDGSLEREPIMFQGYGPYRILGGSSDIFYFQCSDTVNYRIPR